MIDSTNTLSTAQNAQALTVRRPETANRTESAANRAIERPAAAATPSASVQISAAARDLATNDRLKAAADTSSNRATSRPTATEIPAPATGASASAAENTTSTTEQSSRVSQALRLFQSNAASTAEPTPRELRVTA